MEQGGKNYRVSNLGRNFSWSFIGNGFYTLSQWGMITILAKLGTQQMVGQFALGLAIVTPIILFANMQLNAIQVTDAKREYRFGTYIALRLVTTFVALVAILLVALFTQSAGNVSVVLLVAAAKAFESFSEIFYGLYMQNESMDRLAQSMIIKGTLALVGLGAGVYLTDSLVWGVVGMGAGWLFVLLFYDLRNGALLLKTFPEREPEAHSSNGLYTELRPRWEMRRVLELGRIALPMGVVMLFISLNTNIPRYFIENYLGTDDLGIFAAMSYVVISGYMVMRAAGQSVSPRMARYYSDGDERGYLGIILKVLAVSTFIGVAGVAVVGVAGEEILTILYTPEYARATNAFLLMMVAAGLTFMVSALGFGITNARYFGSQIPLLAASSVVTALVCWWLVGAHGLVGAAIALIVGALVQMLGSAAILAHAIRHLRRTKAGLA